MDTQEKYPLSDPLWYDSNGLPLPSCGPLPSRSLSPDLLTSGPVILPTSQEVPFVTAETDVWLERNPDPMHFSLQHTDALQRTIDFISPVPQLTGKVDYNSFPLDANWDGITNQPPSATEDSTTAVAAIPRVPVEQNNSDEIHNQESVFTPSPKVCKPVDCNSKGFESGMAGRSAEKSTTCQNLVLSREMTGEILNHESSPKKRQITKDEKLTKDELETVLKRTVNIPLFHPTETRGQKRRHKEDRESNSQSARISTHSAIRRGETKVGDGFFFVTYDIKDPLECPQCEETKYFPFEDCLERHIWKKHEKQTKKRPYKKRKQERYYKCEECNAEMKNAVNLRRHKDNAHGGEITQTCSYCDAKFSSRHSFVIHMRDQHRVVPDSVKERFGQDVYQERAQQKKSPSAHKNGWIVHRCSGCTYWSDCKANTERHIKLSHLDVREVPCDLCELWFQTKSNMQIHKAAVHRQTKG